MSEEDFDPTKKKKKKKKPFDLDAEQKSESNRNTLPGYSSENGLYLKVETKNEEIGNGLIKNSEPVEDNEVDLSMKKKKKKKPFDIDAALGSEQNEKELEEQKPVTDLTKVTDSKIGDPGNDADEVESFGKKKKKKKVVKIDEGFNETHEAFDMKAMKDAIDDKDGQAAQSMKEDDLDLESFGEKKKKKKKRGIMAELDSETKQLEQEDENSNPWDQSDRDYTYDELLQRVFGIMKQKNPEMVSGEKKKFVMRPPQVMRAGTKKTAFVNFTDMANNLRRQPKHLLSFISAELGTVGAVDGSNQLILKGRFQQKHLENVMRRYIKEYVTCHTCKSPTTILEKEDRIYFLKCMTCQSKCSVQTIKSGFQAVTGKRAAMRAKE